MIEILKQTTADHEGICRLVWMGRCVCPILVVGSDVLGIILGVGLESGELRLRELPALLLVPEQLTQPSEAPNISAEMTNAKPRFSSEHDKPGWPTELKHNSPLPFLRHLNILFSRTVRLFCGKTKISSPKIMGPRDGGPLKSVQEPAHCWPRLLPHLDILPHPKGQNTFCGKTLLPHQKDKE